MTSQLVTKDGNEVLGSRYDQFYPGEVCAKHAW